MKKTIKCPKPLIYIFWGIFTAFFIKFFIADLLYINGTSMEPALKDGQFIIVNKLAYGINVPFSDRLFIQWAEPKPDDIIIYMYEDKIVVKRALCCGITPLDYSTDSSYNLILGGKKIPLTELQYHRMKASTYVPENFVLAVGDNYSQSIDSRTYGFVSTKNILGKVICR